MIFNCFMKTYLRFLFFIVFFISGQLFAQPYNSLPGAQHVIFLDFDGYTVTGTSWNSSYNGGNPIVCAASGYSDAEVRTVFNMMTEDYRPFNINITTDEAVYDAASIQQRMRVLFTPTKNWYPQSAGGVAYLSTFGSISNKVCFIFTSALGNASNAGEAGSHEAGHTLTLQHHSEFNALCEKTNEYNSGTGSGETSWAPIMGVGYNKNMTLWSDVASNFSCTYMQDDLADDDESIRKKIKKAKTDAGPLEPNTPKPDYIENIFLLMKLVSPADVIEKFENDYATANIRYGDMKAQLAEDMVTFIAPIRQKTKDIMQNESYLKQVMEQGAEKARKSAAATLLQVRQSMGLQYY